MAKQISSSAGATNAGAPIAIHRYRDERVVLGQDVAKLFGVETKRLNEQVTRNKEKFGDDFSFRLTAEEPWRWLSALRIVPRPIRDAVYSAVARRRYQLFGKYDTCMIPAPSHSHRFVLD